MLIGIAIEVPFAMGELLLGMEAYFVRDWVSLQMVAYTPLIGIQTHQKSKIPGFSCWPLICSIWTNEKKVLIYLWS